MTWDADKHADAAGIFGGSQSAPAEESHEPFTINPDTGEWLSKGAISHEQACRIAASVLLGITEEQVALWYDKQFAPTDDEREALYLIEQAASFREQTGADVDTFPNTMVGLWLRTANALESALRRSEVPEPSADQPKHLCAAHPFGCPEPQGEPSDAQVERAAKAIAAYQGIRYDWSLKETWREMALAALRAAGGVR